MIRTWFLDTATRMNPNLNYGQAIKGVNTGRGSGLIDTRHFIKLIDAASLLEGSAQWNNADASGLKQWFSAFLDWMQTSVVGLDELDALTIMACGMMRSAYPWPCIPGRLKLPLI